MKRVKKQMRKLAKSRTKEIVMNITLATSERSLKLIHKHSHSVKRVMVKPKKKKRSNTATETFEITGGRFEKTLKLQQERAQAKVEQREVY